MQSDNENGGAAISGADGLLVPLELEVEPGRELVVGRDPSCDVVLSDPTVSRRHLRLFWQGERLFVEDLGSSGGTFVDGEPVQRSEVASGSRLRLGPRAECVVRDATPSSVLRVATRGQRGVEQLQVMLDVARALNAATVLGEVLDVVLEAAMGLMDAAQGWVVLNDGDGGNRVAAARPRELADAAWAEDSSLMRRALADRRTVTSDGPSVESSIIGRGFASGAATPLMVARRPMGLRQDASFVASVEVIGALLVERRAGAPFSPDQLAVFESLAADAAMAIDGARLYRESRDKVKIEHEMELARSIQAALLRCPPGVEFADIHAFSRAARTVGGDLYSVTVRSDGGVALALGDVSGKGVAAALIMAMAQGLLELVHDLGLPLDELPALFNRHLQRHNPGNRFLTLAFGILDRAGGLRLVNAGHCPVAVRRRDGTVEMSGVDGPVLGILPTATWSVQELQLEPGDVLVFYSDGIPESFSADECEFGEEGLRRCLADVGGAPPDEIGRRILDEAAAHRGRADADDDVTLLIVRYTGATS